MFKALHRLARHCTGLTIGVVAENEFELRVTVQPIAGEKAPIINGMVLTGTPEDLEANFIEAIETYEAPVIGILDQAKAAAAKVGESKGDKKALPAPAAGKTAAKTKPAAKPAAKPPAKKKAAPEPDAGAQMAEAATQGSSTDEPTTSDAPAPAIAEPATPATTQEPAQESDAQAAHGESTHRIPTTDGTGPRVKVRTTRTKPGDALTIEQDKAACIADMRAYLAGNAASDKPVKPSRADYLKKYTPATGRRYERLFVSFDEFVAAAQQQALPEVGEAAPNAEAQQPGEPDQTSGSDAVAAAPDAAADASAPATQNPQPAWPMVQPTTDDGTPAAVALKDLQAPADDATTALFKSGSGFALDII